MIVRRLDDIKGTALDVKTSNWVSRRLLLARDGMGFSLHETTIFAGTETHIWYQNHLEAVYCIEGSGEIETVADGRVHAIRPGVVYALDDHDEHYLRAHEDMRLVCVFNPPLTGGEVHDEKGVYPLLADVAE
ncbi:MAG: ectoine synthase [Betaproteobacteria bacterium]|jgi:L-ectoine synthase|nr:ectoine synthase [Betaproteobacteria bacterium]MDH5343440.1 ectoine synthase [Betaproteobacteria bacterium]